MKRNELERNKLNNFMEVNIMGYVITSDGIRMSHKEYLEMVKSERN